MIKPRRGLIGFGLIVALALLEFLQASCATATSRPSRVSAGEITLAEARQILRANPAAIPGYPVRYYRLFGSAVSVEQLLDSASGKAIFFREDREEPPRWSNFKEPSPQQYPDRVERASATPRLWQYQDERARYRKIGGVSVRMYNGSKDLLDRLEEIRN